MKKNVYIRRQMVAGILLFCIGLGCGLNLRVVAKENEQDKELVTEVINVAKIENNEEKHILNRLGTYGYYLDPEQRDYVERVVAAEARGESFEGQAAVAEVILNRAILWDMDVMDVVTAKGQFAAPFQGEISESVKEAVSSVFDYSEFNLNGATHFHADYVNPKWAQEKTVDKVIGSHIFYR